MEIKNLEDIDLVKTAIENYVSNAEDAIKILKESKLPQSMIDTTERSIVRGKELIEELKSEYISALNQKAQDKIASNDITKVIFSDEG